VISVFIPAIIAVPDFGASNRTLFFSLIRIRIHAGRQTDRGRGVEPLLGINEHAIERLFQRMNVISPVTVEDELHEAMLISILAIAVCIKFGLQQIVLPTKSGMFLCAVTSNKSLLVAKTWIANAAERSRNTDAAQSLSSLYDAIGGKAAVAEFLATLPVTGDHRYIPLPDDACEAFQRNVWLKEEYSPRADPVGDAWRRASTQASKSSDG
jgi:hypothetical protein